MTRRLLTAAAKRLITFSLDKTGAYRLFAPFYSGCGSILMFHRVIPPGSGPAQRISLNKSMEISPRYLKEIIQYCAGNGYRFVPLGEVPALLRERGKDKERFVCFTFDDGYADVLTEAYPLFKKHNVPFTLYLATDFPDRKVALWWYVVEDVLAANESVSFASKGEIFTFPLKTARDREKAFFALRSVIFSLPPDSLWPFLEEFCARYKVSLSSYAQKLSLSWDQVRQLARDPLVTIGSHTCSHVNMRSLSDKDILAELETSKARIEEATGVPVEHFSYPFGHSEAAQEREFGFLAASAYRTAVTTRNTNIFPEHADHLHCLPRIGIDGNNETIRNFGILMSGALSAFHYRFRRVITGE